MSGLRLLSPAGLLGCFSALATPLPTRFALLRCCGAGLLLGLPALGLLMLCLLGTGLPLLPLFGTFRGFVFIAYPLLLDLPGFALWCGFL